MDNQTSNHLNPKIRWYTTLELSDQMFQLLERNRLTLPELDRLYDSGELTGWQWGVWDEIEGYHYLLQV